jgi:sugar/nucleoside kinase (ribokinase family)
MDYDILVIGNATVDLIFTGLPNLPELGKEVYSTGFDMIPGEAYNSAVAMHRLGIKVGWAADFGEDDFSRFIVERAQAEGLDEALFVHHRRPFRRISVACSLPEDRAFITYYDPDLPLPAALKALAACSARALLIPGFFYGSLFEAGRKLTRLKGMQLIMDGNSGYDLTLADPAVRRAAEGVDLLLANASEARRLTGEADLEKALRTLEALGPQVVVKDGPRGAFASSGERLVHTPAIPVTPLDTTGAGDCFNAGFLRAWLDHRPVEECLRWGNIVGGLSTTARGATGKVVTRAVVEEWLKKQ